MTDRIPAPPPEITTEVWTMGDFGVDNYVTMTVGMHIKVDPASDPVVGNLFPDMVQAVAANRALAIAHAIGEGAEWEVLTVEKHSATVLFRLWWDDTTDMSVVETYLAWYWHAGRIVTVEYEQRRIRTDLWDSLVEAVTAQASWRDTIGDDPPDDEDYWDDRQAYADAIADAAAVLVANTE